MKKILFTLTLALLFLGVGCEMFPGKEQPTSIGGPTICNPSQGCTGIGSVTAGDVGKVITVSNNSPFTYTLSTVSSTGGSGSSTPGGSNTQVQFNNNGSFGGDSGFTFNSSTGVLSITSVSSSAVTSSVLSSVPSQPFLISTITSSTLMAQSYSVFVSGNYAYSVSLIDDSLTVIDVSNQSFPKIVGVLTDSTNLDGARNVYIAGKYAYIANQNDNSMAIVDISNPSAPTLTGKVKDNSLLNRAYFVNVAGKYAYVIANSDNSMRVIDISSSTAPVIVGGIKDNTNLAGAYGMNVNGRYAYVAASTDNSLRVIDLIDPLNPVIVGGVKDNALLTAARAVYVSGRYAYVTAFNTSTLAIIDVSDPTITTPIVGYVRDTTNLAGVRSVTVQDGYAYVGAATNNSIGIIDVASSTNPQLVQVLKDDTNLNIPHGIYVAGNYLYAAMNTTTNPNFAIVGLNGLNVATANIGALKVSSLNVQDDAIFNRNVSIYSGLNVGDRGIKTSGDLTSDNLFLNGNASTTNLYLLGSFGQNGLSDCSGANEALNYTLTGGLLGCTTISSSGSTNLTNTYVGFGAADNTVTGTPSFTFNTSTNQLSVTNITSTSITSTNLFATNLGADNFKNKTYTITVTTTVGDAQAFAEVTNQNFSTNAEIWLTIHSSGFAQSKRYIIPLYFNATAGAWHKVLPLATTGAFSGNNVELDVSILNQIATFRLRRQAGTTAATAYVNISIGGDIPGTSVTPSSTTFTGASSAANYAPSSITQLMGATGINNDTPSAFLDIVGTTQQLRVGYDSTHYLGLTIDSAGSATLYGSGTGTSQQLRFGYNSSNYLAITVDNTGVASLTGAGSAQIVSIPGSSAVGNTYSLLRLGDTSTGFGGANDANATYLIEQKGTSFLVNGGGITTYTGVKYGMAKEGTWNKADSPLTGINASFVVYTSTGGGTSALPTTTEKFRITGAGMVGIGTTTPVAALTLSVSTTASGGLSFGGDTNLYRSAADTLKTDDALQVGGLLTFTTATGTSVSSTNLYLGGAFTQVSFGDCANAATSKVLYTLSTGLFSCGTDQNSGGSSSLTNRLIAFGDAGNSITSSTNLSFTTSTNVFQVIGTVSSTNGLFVNSTSTNFSFTRAVGTSVTTTNLYVSSSLKLGSSVVIPVANGGTGVTSSMPQSIQRVYTVSSSSFVWTKPQSLRFQRIKVTVVGTGGGGGGNNTTSTKAGGGCGGGFAYGEITSSTLAATSSIFLTLGTAGAGGAINSAGSSGGSTSFGSYLTATGGAGGPNGSVTDAQCTTPGIGSVSTTIAINYVTSTGMRGSSAGPLSESYRGWGGAACASLNKPNKDGAGFNFEDFSSMMVVTNIGGFLGQWCASGGVPPATYISSGQPGGDGGLYGGGGGGGGKYSSGLGQLGGNGGKSVIVITEEYE